MDIMLHEKQLWLRMHLLHILLGAHTMCNKKETRYHVLKIAANEYCAVHNSNTSCTCAGVNENDISCNERSIAATISATVFRLTSDYDDQVLYRACYHKTMLCRKNYQFDYIGSKSYECLDRELS